MDAYRRTIRVYYKDKHELELLWSLIKNDIKSKSPLNNAYINFNGVATLGSGINEDYSNKYCLNFSVNDLRNDEIKAKENIQELSDIAVEILTLLRFTNITISEIKKDR